MDVCPIASKISSLMKLTKGLCGIPSKESKSTIHKWKIPILQKSGLGLTKMPYAIKQLGWHIRNNEYLQAVTFMKFRSINDDKIKKLFGSTGCVYWPEKRTIRHIHFQGCSFGANCVKSMLPFLKSLSNIEYLGITKYENSNQIGRF